MRPADIPLWNAYGVLPPINVENPTSYGRSPYNASILSVVSHFSTTEARISILEGLLRFRESLHSIGLTQGFQWVDGSFVEDVDSNENRSPKDIDIVTFYFLPSGVENEEFYNAHKEIFSNSKIKSDFQVDAYFVSLNNDPKNLVRLTTYWYSVWSHRRDTLWKGYLQVDLGPDDLEAKAYLASLTAGGC